MRRSAVLLLAALLVGCSASTDDDATTAPDLPPLRVMVAGDSLADGYYASTREQSFASLLYDDLAEDHEVTPVTEAVPGARALGVAIQVADETADQPPADVVVLEVGANDVGESTLRAWEQTYRRLLDAVDLSSPDATVVCLGPWNAPTASRPYEAVVRRLCAGQVYVRLSDLYVAPGLRGPVGAETGFGERDSFHPNDAGHAAIAERVLRALDG